MEVYILDDLLRRSLVVDRFMSLIWTERLASFGDFEMVLHSTPESRGRFTTGKRIAINQSHRVMVVETVEDTMDSDGKQLLKVRGRSLEIILEDRVAKDTLSGLTAEPKWVLTGNAPTIAKQIFHDICVLGQLSSWDKIPYINEGPGMYAEDTIAEPPEVLTIGLEPMTVYKAIKDICDIYHMGFRLVRNFDSSQLYFDVYMGSDRTSGQGTLPAVIFSPELDNLRNTTEYTSVEQAKNVAYVFSPVGYKVVYPEGVDPDVEGFERRVLLVIADDITSTDPPTAANEMTQRGRFELTQNQGFSAFDGEIAESSEYKYGIHYNLGDLVEIRNEDGIGNSMQVSEQIFVCDGEGERSYPTLAINQFIMPGSWLAWDYNQVWIDLGATEYWANA
jgi:hypothetical protein